MGLVYGEVRNISKCIYLKTSLAVHYAPEFEEIRI